MKKINVKDAVGMVLCHDITAINDDFKGALFKRSHVIKECDIDTLLDIGKKSIYVWEENKDEIHEEDAAHRMAKMIPERGFHYSNVSEGKISGMSDVDGMFMVDSDLLGKVNSIKDITVSTFLNHYPVKKGMRVFSMRIVPLVTEQKNIEEMQSLLHGKQLIQILTYSRKRVGVIITGSEVYSGRIKDKFEPVIRKKLSHFPSDIIGVKICDDDIDMIQNAATEFIDKGADIVIFTGGMSVDPDDLTPTAIANLSTDMITKGVPSQPGNMTPLAYKKDTALIGVPGAAIKSKVTVLDALLPQLFTGLKLTKQDIINLGEGGLCQFCDECHFPNCTFGKY